MESSPLGTGDFAVNAGFAALTLDPNDAKALASPLTPAERRSVVAALAHRGDRSSWLDGGDEGGGADASAFSPAVAAVVAKAVAGKILTLEEKGALQSAMGQEKRRRARARRAELEDAEPAGLRVSRGRVAVRRRRPRADSGPSRRNDTRTKTRWIRRRFRSVTR